MIYDCFDFYNELDILEIRLNTLNDLVDYFVISEAPVMFSGLPKPLFFEEHKNEERFKKFEYKIIHQIVTDTPDDYVNLSPNSATDEFHRLVIERVLSVDLFPRNHTPYGRDAYQKESLLRPLKNCNPDDIIMISDADEIPNPDTLKTILDNFNPDEIYNLKQKMLNYYFNCQKFDCPDESWMGNTILTFENFLKFPMCLLRLRRRGIVVDNGGWHFSFMGGAEGSLTKMISGNETYMYTDHVKNSIQDNIDHCLTYNHDVFFRPCRFELVPVENKYILDNLEKFKVHIR
jgi:beta-1,4-mannosyl-glycoprotein beta-1,4-N-acetylglucosaminyltransferase